MNAALSVLCTLSADAAPARFKGQEHAE